MTDKILVEDLHKIFGPDPEHALDLLGQGCGKDEIFERTRTTIGVQKASFRIREGEVFVVMGLSGSGKSTLVRMLNRLIEPTRGSVYVDGQDVTRMGTKELIALRRREMSMVFQSFALMPHRSVLDNAAFGLEVGGMPRRDREARAIEALETVGLRPHAESYPGELSGGMQQRVGLARALATHPSILLMDEAFSALDPLIRTEMQDELVALQRRSARTIVFISHDLDEAIRIGDRIAIMDGGAVVQIGTPEEIVSEPANEYVRSFFYGVDVSKVFQASHIAEDRLFRVTEHGGSSLAAILAQLRDRRHSEAVIVDREGRYRGMVSADSLASAAERRRDAPLDDAFLEGTGPVPADTGLSEVISRVAKSRHPVAVVDGNGRYLGVITKALLLQALDKGE